MRGQVAHLRLLGAGPPAGSAKDAFGARLTLTAAGGAWRRHATVFSAQGFSSQNSAWTPLSLGPHREAHVEIRWPSGHTSVEVVHGGERRTVTESL